MELPLDLRQTSEKLRQLGPAPIPPNDEHRLGRIASGVGKPLLSSSLLGRSQQILDCVRHRES